jgi:hypothetical protein
MSLENYVIYKYPMNKVVSYHEFLRNKENIRSFIENILNKIPDITIYFPNNLNTEERHLIYQNSSNYLFEKLNKVGSNYSIKIWKKPDDETGETEADGEPTEVVPEDNETIIDDEDEYEDEDEGVKKLEDICIELDYCRRLIVNNHENSMQKFSSIQCNVSILSSLVLANIALICTIIVATPVKIIVEYPEWGYPSLNISL